MLPKHDVYKLHTFYFIKSSPRGIREDRHAPQIIPELFGMTLKWKAEFFAPRHFVKFIHGVSSYDAYS